SGPTMRISRPVTITVQVLRPDSTGEAILARASRDEDLILRKLADDVPSQLGATRHPAVRPDPTVTHLDLTDSFESPLKDWRSAGLTLPDQVHVDEVVGSGSVIDAVLQA